MTIPPESFYRYELNTMPSGWPKGISKARIASQVAFLVCFTLCFVLFARSASPDQLSVDEILKKVSETYQQLQSFQIAAEMTTQVQTGAVRLGENAESRGQQLRDNDGRDYGGPGSANYSTIYAASPPPIKSQIDLAEVNPGKFRLQFKDANTEVVLVSDGLTTWGYSPKKKQYTEKPKAASAAGQSEPVDKAEMASVSQYEGLLINRFRDLAKYSSSFVLEKETQLKLGGDKVNCYLLKMTTPQGVHQIWVDKTRFIVLRSVDANPAEVRGGIPYHKTLTVDLKTANLNAKLQDDLFKFAPPDNAKKVDSLNPPAK